MAVKRSTFATSPTPLRVELVEIGEPIAICIAHYHTVTQRNDFVLQLARMPGLRHHLILGVSPGLDWSDSWSNNWTDRRLPTTIPELYRFVVTSEGPNQRSLISQVLVRAEADPFRAVVGAMLDLQPKDTFALALPAVWQGPCADYLVEQGRRWRAALQAPEDGEFFPI